MCRSDFEPTRPSGSIAPTFEPPRSLWEGGVRGPAFVHYPRAVPAGTYGGLAHISDWFPTLLDAAGVRSLRRRLIVCSLKKKKKKQRERIV